jgi:glycosyltransferase involved in cell wall biosynthesis
MTPFFSIIIATYNCADKLPNAIASILLQLFQEYEIIILDGLSTDNTVEIANKFDDRRVVVLSEKDLGVYDAMNKGILKSRGEWIYFLGADDNLYNEQVLQTISNETKSHLAPVIYGNVNMRGDSPWAKNGEIYAGRFNLKKLLTQNICQQAIFYKREVFNKIGLFDIRYEVAADWDFNLRCFASMDFHYIDVVIATFSSGGLSSTIEDTLFLKDRIRKISGYFRTRLYKDEFLEDRFALRKLAFEKNKTLSPLSKLLILLGTTVLQFKVWFRRGLIRKT